MEPKEENPKCFCFASNHTERGREHHSLCFLCCWFGICLQRLLKFCCHRELCCQFCQRRNATCVTSQIENNQCLHISPACRLPFILLLSIHRTHCHLHVFLKMTKQNQSLLFSVSLCSFDFLPYKKSR